MRPYTRAKQGVADRGGASFAATFAGVLSLEVGK
jgi:hypothetical protein